MPSVVEQIPSTLAAEAEAARAWFANAQGVDFKLTGIVDPEDTLAQQGALGHDLQLILCGVQNGQDVCLRERFQVQPRGGDNGFDVTHVAASGPEIGSPAPLLDPPQGVRASWLEDAMARHNFVVVLFYRGFW